MMKAGAGLLGALIAVGLTSGPSSPAVAESDKTVCGPRDKIIERLAVRFDERQSAIGMTGGGSLVELFVSPDGSWTFVHTTTEGVSCLLAAGENWEQLPETPAQPLATPS